MEASSDWYVQMQQSSAVRIVQVQGRNRMMWAAEWRQGRIQEFA